MAQTGHKTNWKFLWILNSAVIITLVFNQNLADPFNSPKFWVLLICTSVILGPIIEIKNQFSQTDSRVYSITRILLLIFLISALFSSVFAYNKQVAFLGENFRRNGLLTILCFGVFFIGVIKLIRFNNINKLFIRITFVGSVTGIYSILQITKNDFVDWSDKSAVITTLGNSNFAGSAMAIFAIICFGQLFIKTNSIIYRLASLSTLLLLLFAIENTNARQALFIFVVGTFIIMLNQVLKYSKRLAMFLFTTSIFFGLFAVLGMLQIGPLQEFFYKGSVTIRGYYWRAGIEMFMNSPLFGVGIDNYGSFFKQYRETNYTLNYGFGITSTNAHNVFLQYFATGGFFVGAAYILIQSLIFKRAWILFRKTYGVSRDKAIVLIAGWIAFQAQSIISVDNVGLSIWGWVLGGSILGISLDNLPETAPRKKTSNKSVEFKWKPITVSGVLVLSSFYLISDLYVGERYTMLSKSYAIPDSTDKNIQNLFEIYSGKALSSRFVDIDYKNIVYTGMWQMGYRDASLKGLEQINKRYPRNLDTLTLLAIGNEQIRNFESGIAYRKRIAELDPWNAQNYLALGLVYKYTGDFSSMDIMLEKILSFAKNDPIAKTALNELTNPNS